MTVKRRNSEVVLRMAVDFNPNGIPSVNNHMIERLNESNLTYNRYVFFDT